MSLLIHNQMEACIEWSKVISLEDVIDWHLKFTPWIGRRGIMDLAKIYIDKKLNVEGLLEKGEVFPEAEKFQTGGEFGELLKQLYQ